ncbi:MAG: hypothetical protein AAGI71_10635 [Bacteroidota bacterium]
MLVSARPLQAQPALLAQADSLLRLGQDNAARAQLETALANPALAAGAHVRLGDLEAKARRWRPARRHYDDALKRRPALPGALLGRAIVHREQGRFRTPVARVQELVDWREAEARFEQVLAQDSAYADALLQYSVLERYRRRWDRALALAHAQLRLAPEHPEAAAGLATLYLHLLAKGVTDVDTTGWPAGQAAFWQAEGHRWQRDWATADAGYAALVANPGTVPLPLIHLRRALVAASNGEDHTIDEHVAAALAAVRHRGDAELVLADMAYAFHPDELAAFDTLQAAADVQAFFERAWVRRDPRPARPGNERLRAHYQRLHVALRDYSVYSERVAFRDPDRAWELGTNPLRTRNWILNDKGLIYLRHGPPDEDVRTTVTTANSLGLAGTVESWRYRERGAYPEMIFHFETVAGGHWRLTPGTLDPAFLDDRLEWGPVYNPMSTRSDRRFELAEEARAAVDTAFVLDRHAWDPAVQPLPTLDMLLAFRDEGGTRLEWHYAFPLQAVDAATDASTVRLEAGLALHSMAWEPVATATEPQRIRLSGHGGRAGAGRLSVVVPPDSYHVAVHLSPEEVPLVSASKRSLAVPAFEPGALGLSDVLVAARLEPRTAMPTTRADYLILPNPTRSFERTRPVFLFVEVYELTRDERGETAYEVAYTLTPVRTRRRLFRRRSSVALTGQYEQRGVLLDPVETAQLDVQDLKAGRYQIQVTVTDLHTGEAVARTQEIRLQ